MEFYELGKDARLVTEGEAALVLIDGPALNVRRALPLNNPQTVESAKLFPTPIQSDEKIAKEAGINPKDALGAAKPSMGLIPVGAMEEVARVMELGAKKYGPYNWRSRAVKKMVYANAALRHLFAWIGGQDKDPESGASHLAHVAACVMIVLDADSVGKAVEDREWLK